MERALGGELTHHLGYPPGAATPELTTNHRKGTSGKTVLTADGAVAIEVPRDREGPFAPQLIGPHERRCTGFDDKVMALYARGLTVREIPAFLTETYAIDVSPDRIRTVTDAIVAEVTAWQSRPLEPRYPVVFFDALRVKIRDDAVVRRTAVYLAVAVLPDGTRDMLGIWIEQTEGAKFWMKVLADLKPRGGQDILIAVTDGLTGRGEALAAVFPATTLPTGIVHLIRHSVACGHWQERKHVAAALRPIDTAPSADAGSAALDAFEQSAWGRTFPTVVAAWRRAWTHVMPFFAVPPEIRRLIDTTNARERLHRQLRKIINTRGHFPSDDAATTLLWLVLRNITATWERPAYAWRPALNQLAILYGDRFTPLPS